MAIALFNVSAITLSVETVLRVMATDWFGEPDRALVPLGVLWLALLAATLVARVCIVVPALRAPARAIFALGAVVTALILIRVQVFPTVAAGDWRWLSSFGDLTSLVAERPHAEIGLLVLSVLLWVLGDNVARNAGELDQRRANFLGFFWAMVGSIALSLFAAQGVGELDLFIALALPFYVVCGLLMLAQVRLAEMRVRTARTGVAMQRARWVWRAVTVGLTFTSLFFVFVSAALFYGDAYRQLFAVIGVIWDGLITVVALVIGLLATPFFLVTGFLRNNQTTAPSTTPKPVSPPTTETPLSPATVHQIYGIVLIVVMVVIALVVLYRNLRTLRKGNDSAVYTETRERLAPEQVARVARSATTDPTAPPSAGSVRAIYRTLLRRMTKAGLTRDPDETPAEYAARLSPHLGGAPTDDAIVALGDLTTAYHDERYGGVAPTPSLFARAQAALRRLLRHDDAGE